MNDFRIDDMYRDKDCKKIKDECLIAFKVYDQCRQQDCLTPAIIGPARFNGATGCTLGGEVQTEGAPIDPPNTAAAVTIVPGSVNVSEIIVVGKTENQFRPGYYDVDLKVVITYNLRFFDVDGDPIILTCGYTSNPDVPAASIFNKRVTLFGSIGSDVAVYSDLFGSGFGLQKAPFLAVEAKALGLDAKLKYVNPIAIPTPTPIDAPPTPNAVNVTLGLFIIIKLFRLVQLLVESKGFCKPEPCAEISPDACEFFNNLDFPFDIFNPPQKEDFRRD